MKKPSALFAIGFLGFLFQIHLLFAGTLELDFSTYLGGSGEDVGNGITVGTGGEAYVVGYTYSLDFPLDNAYQTSLEGSHNVFVIKLSSSGSSLVYATYLGGSNADSGCGIALGMDDEVYITGATYSSNFPTVNAYQSTSRGNHDAFVSSISSSGSSLIYSTYFGGSDSDIGTAIAHGTTGNTYIVGTSYSSIHFPILNPYQVTGNGAEDVFVSSITSSGSSLIYSTFIGGDTSDCGSSIALGTTGEVYITGWTNSSNFPVLGPYQATYRGGFDAFVTSLSTSGSLLIYSTYLGGSDSDSGYGIALGTTGRTYVAGWTRSSDFPGRWGDVPGGNDVFVSNLSSSGSSLGHSTFLGGADNDQGSGIALGTGGEVYVTGWTISNDFPILSPYQATRGGIEDIFLSVISSSSSSLIFSTYLGGSGTDQGHAIALGTCGEAYVTGYTQSVNFPSANSYQTTNNGDSDAFVSKLIFSSTPKPTTTSSPTPKPSPTRSPSPKSPTPTPTQSPTPPPTSQYAYVANHGSSNVSVIELKTYVVVKTIPVGYGPSDITANPQGTRVYVAHPDLDTISVIDTATNTVITTISVGDSPLGMAVNPAGTELYVADELGSVIDTTTNTVTRSLGFVNRPMDFIFTPDGTRLCATMSLNESITIANPQYPSERYAQIYIHENVFRMAMNAAGSELYALCTTGIAIVDPRLNSDYFRIKSSYTDDKCDVAINPSSTKLYVSGDSSVVIPSVGYISMIDPSDFSLLKDIAVGGSPCGIALNDDWVVYVANSASDTVSVISSIYNQAIATIPVGDEPKYIALVKINPPTPSPSATIPTTRSPTPTPSASPTLRPSTTPTATPKPTATASTTPSPYRTASPSPSPTCGPIIAPYRNTIASGDYNGDGASDIAIFHPSTGLWLVKDVTRLYFGEYADHPVAGDYDGDGSADVATFRPSAGLWSVRGKTRAYFGVSADLPAPADYDGDGSCDIGIFRENGGMWVIRNLTRFYFGATNDWPLPGDWDGSEMDRAGVYRPSSGQWMIRDMTRFYLGSSSDWPIQGDFGGEERLSAGVFRPCSGLWAIRNSTRLFFGNCLDYPVPADYTGGGIPDIGVFRDSAGLWSLRNITRIYFGGTGDIPVTR